MSFLQQHNSASALYAPAGCHTTMAAEAVVSPSPLDYLQLTDRIAPDNEEYISRPPRNHVPSVQEFVDKMNESIPHMLAKTRTYDNVMSCFITWKDHDNPAIIDSAADLKDLLENEYGYAARKIILESSDQFGSDPTSQFIKEVSDHVYSINRERDASGERPGNNLFILYYGGNGAYKKVDCKGIWLNRKIEGYSSIEWEAVEHTIKAAKCDILLLLDCCYSTGIVSRGKKWPRRCEILSACGTVELTSARSNNFTAALTSVLKNSINNPRTAAQLSWQLSDKMICTKFDLKATPQWGCLSEGETINSSIMLAPRRAGQSSIDGHADTTNGAHGATMAVQSGSDEFHRAIKEAEEASDAHVLMAIRFTNPNGRPFLEEWLEWISKKPQNISDLVLENPEGFIQDLVHETMRKSVKCHCAFPSDSALGIISVPIWLWSCLGPGSAWIFIDIIRSDQNLLQPAIRSIAPKLRAIASRAVQTAFIDDARPPTPPSPVFDVMTSALGREEQQSAQRPALFSHRRAVVIQERAAKSWLGLPSLQAKLSSSLYQTCHTISLPVPLITILVRCG